MAKSVDIYAKNDINISGDNGDMKNASAKKKIKKFKDKSRTKDVKKKNKPKVLKEKLEFSKDRSFAYTQ